MTTPPQAEMTHSVPEAPHAPGTGNSMGRLQSLDAFRGAIMLLMASSGFGIPQVAKNFPALMFTVGNGSTL